MNQKQELLTAEELAERLRVRPSTVRRWARSGRIPQISVSAKVLRFEYVAVLDALRARRQAHG